MCVCVCAYLQAGDFDQAFQYYYQAVKFAPKLAPGQYGLGQMYINRDDLPKVRVRVCAYMYVCMCVRVCVSPLSPVTLSHTRTHRERVRARISLHQLPSPVSH